MTRQGPNYHDDPREETAPQQEAQAHTPSESDKRIARSGADMVRIALGLPTKHAEEAKAAFVTDEAKRLQRLITNSDLEAPQIKSRLELMISAAHQRGAITPPELEGLNHYLHNSEGFSDDQNRERDYRERQYKDS